MYPYDSHKKCPICKDNIVITRKRDELKTFCSLICYYKSKSSDPSRPYMKKPLLKRKCRQCQKDFTTTVSTKQYCSKSCAKLKNNYHICRCCGKEFKVMNAFEIKRGKAIYCSLMCSTRKYMVNNKYFSNLNDEEVSYNLGYIYGVSKISGNDIIIVTDNFEKLDKLNQQLSSNHPIHLYRRKYKLMIISAEMVSDLIIAGMSEREIDYEYPDGVNNINFINGYISSSRGSRYKIKGREYLQIDILSSKLCSEFCRVTGGKMVRKGSKWCCII